jgi:hypothetical protein
MTEDPGPAVLGFDGSRGEALQTLAVPLLIPGVDAVLE